MRSLVILFILSGHYASAQSDSLWSEYTSELHYKTFLLSSSCDSTRIEKNCKADTYIFPVLPEYVEQNFRKSTDIATDETLNFTEVQRYLDSSNRVAGYSAMANINSNYGPSLRTPVWFDSSYVTLNIEQINSALASVSHFETSLQVLKTTLSSPDSVNYLDIHFDCAKGQVVYNYHLWDKVLRVGLRNVKVEARTISVWPQEGKVFRTTAILKHRKFRRRHYNVHF